VVGVLPHDEDMLDLGSSGIFSLRYPDHLISREMRRIVKRLTS